MFLHKISALLTVGMGLLCGASAWADADRLENPYGTASHLFGWEYDKAEEEFKMMKNEGINYLRGPGAWAMVMPAPGQWYYETFDNVLKYGEQAGVGYIPILHWPPDAFDPPKEHMTEWLEYVGKMVDRYGNRVYGFEVWNEANMLGMSAVDYAELIKATAAKIRKRNDKVKVLYGGTSDIPLSYIEETYKNGAAQVMDVMCVHPYRWNDIPETSLPQELLELKELMKKYGAGDKPIWLTEVGYSSEPRTDFLDIVLPKIFAEMELDPVKTTAVTFFDPAFRYYTETHTFPLREIMPKLRSISRITMNKLKNMPVRRNEVLILADTQMFPAGYIDALIDFVKRGGKVISPAGFPLYFELHNTSAGEGHSIQVNDKYMQSLHMGWEAAWVKEDVPARSTGWRWASKTEKSPLPKVHSTYYFFNGDNLAEGDKLTPILYGTADNYAGISAGVYHFNSDLKGKIGVGGLSWRGCTEEDQARLMPRLFLISFAYGADKIFWHNYRATEVEVAEVEAYFGLHTLDLKCKPVCIAYQMLIKKLPSGSTRPQVSRHANVYVARWQQPDGKKVFAVWTDSNTSGTHRFRVRGTDPAVTDHLGNNVAVLPVQNNVLTLKVGQGVTYIENVDEFNF